jgi:hypothetical protein
VPCAHRHAGQAVAGLQPLQRRHEVAAALVQRRLEADGRRGGTGALLVSRGERFFSVELDRAAVFSVELTHRCSTWSAAGGSGAAPPAPMTCCTRCSVSSPSAWRCWAPDDALESSASQQRLGHQSDRVRRSRQTASGAAHRNGRTCLLNAPARLAAACEKHGVIGARRVQSQSQSQRTREVGR